MREFHSGLVRKLCQKFQAEAVAYPVPHDCGDASFAQGHELDFREVSGMEIGARAKRHPTFTHFQSKAWNYHFIGSVADCDSNWEVDWVSLPAACVFGGGHAYLLD
jgi:hypothetical protein